MRFEEVRKRGASIFVYLIFCLLIAIFVINFRPGQGGDSGCRGESSEVLSVDGASSTQTAYKVAYSNPYNQGRGKTRVYIALETLIRRELLADAAELRGLVASEDLVMAKIKQGHYYLGGQHTQIPGIFFETGQWNLQAFRNWVGQLNVSQNAYIEEQRRSLLASMMAEILTESVQVSRDEALHKFMAETNTVTYDVVAFKPELYRSSLRMTDADIERFIANHGDEVQARYKADERTYKGVKPQLKLRQIFIASSASAKPDAAAETKPSSGSDSGAKSSKDGPSEESAAATGDGSKSKTSPATEAAASSNALSASAAQAKLTALRESIAGDKRKFVDAAKTRSSDDAMKAVGGELGWRSVENATLGDKVLDAAAKVLKPGDISPVLVTDRGAYLLLAEDKREGDLSYDQVKAEIAVELAKDTWGKEAAKRAAIAALDRARSGTGTNLDQLFKPDVSPQNNGGNPGIQLEQLLDDPNLPEEQKQKLREMLQRNKQGALLMQEGEKDILASWNESSGDGSGSAGSGSAGSAARDSKSAEAAGGAPAVAPTEGAKPGAKTGDKTADKADKTDKTAAPKPQPPVTASSEQLPTLGDVPEPHTVRFGPSARGKQMPGLGSSKEAIAAVFDGLQPGNIAKQVYEADGAYIAIQLIARVQPNVADFDKTADRRVAELRETRGQQFLDDWLKTKCEALAKEGKIKPAKQLLVERDEQGNILPIGYKPCMSFR